MRSRTCSIVRPGPSSTEPENLRSDSLARTVGAADVRAGLHTYRATLTRREERGTDASLSNGLAGPSIAAAMPGNLAPINT